MTFLYIIFSIWVGWIFLKTLSFIYLWYIKEYRFDRMLAYIKSEGFLFLAVPHIRRPPVRLKVFLLIIITIFLLSVLYNVLPFHLLINLLVIDIFLFSIISFAVFLLKLPTAVYHEYRIWQATIKLRMHKPMIVIGITGSIGKSTTKEFLATILMEKFQVLKTAGSQNTAIGVAEIVLRDLRSDHEVFIVEMGAYKKGEIKKIANMVKPQIGIVTMINEQHLDLFGSLEKTMEAKYELVDALQGKSIAIFNADNAYTRHMATRARGDGKKVWMYTRENTKFDIAQEMFSAHHIQAGLENVACVVQWKNRKDHLQIPILGEHQVSTVLAAICGAAAAGMEYSDVMSAAKNIRSFRKTMELVQGPHGSVFIDDTYNNNPQAAKAALQFISREKVRKFLVFQPMIELGSYAQKDHEDIGKIAGDICDDIILTNELYSNSFIHGVESSRFHSQVRILPPKKAAEYLLLHIKKNDIVLFKGKEAGKVLANFL